MKKPNVKDALVKFVGAYKKANPVLYTPFDSQWRSLCEMGDPIPIEGQEMVRWRPVANESADNFSGLENALDMRIHADIKEYYGTFWSAGMEATATDGHVSLLFTWNQQDVDRLIENLIGHSLAKRKSRQPFTVFFACTEPESDLFLSIDNESGAVVLEQPGGKPLRQIATNVADFLNSLTPANPDHHPEYAL